ncbi:MAG: ferritin [Dehalococcoidia bacterium]
MLSEKMAQAINTQINKEIYSGYFYMAMSAEFTSLGLKGFANWFMVQYHEEMAHAMKFYNYLHDQGNRVKLLAIDEPPADFKSPLDMCERTLAHEKFVTSLINGLVELAVEEKDEGTRDFLQWYVKEQVEEEESAGNLVEKVKAAGEDEEALKKVDKELAGREFHPPK